MESLDEENFGGYDAYFINEILDEHECPVCKMALRKPIQTQCGHRLCLSCAEEMRKRKEGVLICPLDNSILDSSKIFTDIAVKRVIMQLKVKCSNFSNGCEWTGELKILNEHLGSCEYQTLKCLNNPCSTSLLLKNLKEHMEKHCIYRLVTCQYCEQKIIFREKQGMRKEHETHASSLMQNHLSMAISKLDALENKITLTVDTLENKIASKVNALENKIMLRVDALENKIMSKVESLETKTVSKVVALENKITSKVESFENKNASEVVALENKITSTVDALKNELISKVDAQKNKIMLHEKNLEIIKAFLAVKTAEFVHYEKSLQSLRWLPSPCNCASSHGCLSMWIRSLIDRHVKGNVTRTQFLQKFRLQEAEKLTLPCTFRFPYFSQVVDRAHLGSVFISHVEIQKKLQH
ncbi:TNF receptor-associated factor 3-like isoform X4 [Hydra vulgaris]|uniref:TNF receptor-associated factor 3-like isoform X4 n=1 Tax=Hydra vulgaris TaxID=6087 RepID=A0ABM4CED8_HYDVU